MRHAFYHQGYAPPTDEEVLVLAVLFTQHMLAQPHGRDGLRRWESMIEPEIARAQEMGHAWVPPKGVTLWDARASDGAVLPMAQAVVAQVGVSGIVETVAAVVDAWAGVGATTTATTAAVNCYLMKIKQKAFMGPKRDAKGHASPRHIYAIPLVAAFLRDHGAQIRHLLDRHTVESSYNPRTTNAELQEQMEQMDVDHAATLSTLAAENAAAAANHAAAEKALQAKVTAAKKAQSKAQTRATAASERVRGTAKRVRAEERAKLPGIREGARQQADEGLKLKAVRTQELSTAAHAAKREWKRRAEAAQVLAAQRQAKLKSMEVVDESVLEESDDEMDVNATTVALHADAYAKLQAMPTWQRVRGKGSGRGRAKLEDSHRETIYSMFANQTPLSAISPNIITVVKRTAPWLNPAPVSNRTLIDCRFELRFMEQYMAARQVAFAYAIRMLGFDETTKDGDPSITSNVIIEPTKGAVLKPVILIGAYCSAGGTAEKVAAAIETKCFAKLRDFIRRVEAKFRELYPTEEWAGPKPEDLSMARLGGGGGIQSDTCNTAEKAKAILAKMISSGKREMIGEEAWAALSQEEQDAATRVHKLDCHQHMRNIFLKEMSTAQAAHVAAELKPFLDAFSSWDRMTTDYTQLLRAAYKELHHGNKYYKGKGREFWVWLRRTHPKVFAIHFERAEGGRQDLDYDAAIPLYVMRPYMVEFLHTLVFCADHSNILEDFLYVSFSSMQYVAMTRANAIIDLLVSRPLRWLTGCAYELDSFSPVTLLTIKDGQPLHASPLDLVEQLFTKASTDGSLLLDATLDIFKPIADVQPKFAAHRTFMYEKDHVMSPDGSVPHLLYKLVRDELFNPTDPTNQATRLKTIEYLEVQCVAGLRKLHDKKLAIAKHLASQDGVSSFANSVQMHIDTIGLDASNDRLAESVFGRYDYIRKRCPGISMEAASAVAQAISAKSFEPGGYFHSLSPHEQHAVIEVARTTVRELRAVDRADHAEHDDYVEAKRKSNSQLELDALVKEYALAITFFKKWKRDGVADAAAMRAALASMPNDQARLDYLRLHIEMRVRGLGFVEFRPRMRWSSSKDEDVGTIAELTALLEEILMEERDLDCSGDLPESAVVPIMKRKTYRELGESTAQAKELGSTIKELSPEELLELANARRAELEAAGEIDRAADDQPDEPPARDDSLVSSSLELCWRYWRPLTEAEIAKGDKRKRIQQFIWCECDVVLVANGTTTTEQPENAKCKKLAQAGAVRIKWPADKAREEPETFSWHILQDADFAPRKDCHLAWRLSAAELQNKRAEAAMEAEPAHKRRR